MCTVTTQIPSQSGGLTQRSSSHLHMNRKLWSGRVIKNLRVAGVLTSCHRGHIWGQSLKNPFCFAMPRSGRIQFPSNPLTRSHVDGQTGNMMSTETLRKYLCTVLSPPKGQEALGDSQAFILIFAPRSKLLCFRRPAHATCVTKQVIASISTPVEIPTSTSAQVQETLDCHREDTEYLRQQFSPNNSDMADYLKDYGDIFQRHHDRPILL